MPMLQAFYDWALRLSRHRNAERSLFAICFAESSVLPALPEVLLVPMILENRERAWRLAFVCTLGSVLGGLLGYGIGVFLFEAVGQPLLALYGMTGQFDSLARDYNELGWLMVLVGGATPVPYKVVTILSGVTQLDLWVFLSMSVISRAARFFVPCAMLYWFGPRARTLLERNLSLVFWVSVAGLVLGVLLVGVVL